MECYVCSRKCGRWPSRKLWFPELEARGEDDRWQEAVQSNPLFFELTVIVKSGIGLVVCSQQIGGHVSETVIKGKT